jgi:hypothetical protein
MAYESNLPCLWSSSVCDVGACVFLVGQSLAINMDPPWWFCEAHSSFGRPQRSVMLSCLSVACVVRIVEAVACVSRAR